jgi:hypothetical protein
MNEVLLRPARTAALAVTAGLVALAGIGPAATHAAEPWGFEQVTPPVKDGGAIAGLDTFQTSPDGESFLYTAGAAFGTVPAESAPQYIRYLATRGAESWVNRSVEVPFGGEHTHFMWSVMGTSKNLEYALVVSAAALAPGAAEGGTNIYLRTTRTGALKLIMAGADPNLVNFGPMAGLMFKFAADDGKSALFVVKATSGSSTRLYSWTEAHGLEVASVLPDGGDVVSPDSVNSSEVGVRDSIPDGDGLAHVYFSTPDGPVYERAGGQTIPVSYSRIPGEPETPVSATLAAVGRDGRYALFTTAGPTRLTEDTPTDVVDGLFVYRYDADAESEDALTYIGVDGPSWLAGMRSGPPPLQMAQDGQTIALQSAMVLADGAVEGQQNTYVWRNGALRHVFTTDNSMTPDWNGAASFGNWWRVLSTNGRYFAFTDNSPSLALAAGYDEVGSDCSYFYEGPKPCDQVYIYDADADELSCASCPPDGAPMKDHASEPGSYGGGTGYMRMNARQPQNAANDGTVFFTSPNDLIAADSNGARDAYAFRDGELRLIGRASQGTSSRFLDATPDGGTVFFATDDRIVGTDRDREVDIYVTRQGAGYPYSAPTAKAPCEGVECRDATAPADGAGTVAGSLTFSGRGNVAKRPAKVSVSRIKAVIGSVGTLRVRVPGGGRVTTSGAGLRRSHVTAKRAGTVKVPVRLSKAAKRSLARGGRVDLRAKVRFVPSSGAVQVARAQLTFKKPKPRRGAAKGGR